MPHAFTTCPSNRGKATHKPEVFIIATTGILTAGAKDWLSSQDKVEGMKLVLWERTDIETLLDHHRDLRSRFLGEPYEPDYLLDQIKVMTHRYRDFDCVLLTPTARAALTQACHSAIEMKTDLTTAHLLAALLELDIIVTRPLFEKCGMKAVDLIKELQTSVAPPKPSPQPRAGGLNPSFGFRLCLEGAFAVKDLLPEGGLVSERALLISALEQKRSKTIQILSGRLGNKTMQLLTDTAWNRKHNLETDTMRENALSYLQGGDTEILPRYNEEMTVIVEQPARRRKKAKKKKS